MTTTMNRNLGIMDTDLIRNEAAHDRNNRKPGGTRDYPCIVCGAEVKQGKGGKAFWLHGGGGEIVTEAEGERRMSIGDTAGDCGTYPIGANCYRKHKDVLAPFVLGDY